MLGLSIFSSAVIALVCLTDTTYAGRKLTGVRLVDMDGGYTSNEGTIEFMVTDGTTTTWETMCGTYLGSDLAGDICRYLGFSGVTEFIHTGSTFPKTIWPPTISMFCGSDAMSFEECTLLAIPPATACAGTLAAIICSVATTTDGTTTTAIKSTEPPIMTSSAAPPSTTIATTTSTTTSITTTTETVATTTDGSSTTTIESQDPPIMPIMTSSTAPSSTTMATTSSTTASPTTTTETVATTTDGTSTTGIESTDTPIMTSSTASSSTTMATTTSTTASPTTTTETAVIVGPAAGGAVCLILLIVLTVVAVRKCRSNREPGRVKVVHDRDSWAMYNDNDDNLYHMPDEDHATNNSSRGVINTVAQHFPEDVNGLYASVDETGPNDMKNIPLHNMYAKPKKEKKPVATGYGDLYAKPSKARPEPEGGEISDEPSYFVLERDREPEGPAGRTQWGPAPAPAPVPGPGPRGSTIKPAEELRVALPAEQESYYLPMDKHRASREYDSTNMVENELYN